MVNAADRFNDLTYSIVDWVQANRPAVDIEDITDLATCMGHSPLDPAELAIVAAAYERACSIVNQIASQIPTTQEQPPAAAPKNNAEKMSLTDAISNLLHLQAKGEQYTSQRKLADQIGCGATLVGDAIRETPELQRWAADKGKKTATVQALPNDDRHIPAAPVQDTAAELDAEALRNDPALMDKALQELKSQAEKQYSDQPEMKQGILDAIDSPAEDIDRAKLITLLRDQLQDDRRQKVLSNDR